VASRARNDFSIAQIFHGHVSSFRGETKVQNVLVGKVKIVYQQSLLVPRQLHRCAILKLAAGVGAGLSRLSPSLAEELALLGRRLVRAFDPWLF